VHSLRVVVTIGHACGVKVQRVQKDQRVQKVHRVQRVWYRPWNHYVAGFRGFRRFKGFRGGRYRRFTAMNMKSALRYCLPALIVILSEAKDLGKSR
jgi:hypothetical protein